MRLIWESIAEDNWFSPGEKEKREGGRPVHQLIYNARFLFLSDAGQLVLSHLNINVVSNGRANFILKN